MLATSSRVLGSATVRTRGGFPGRPNATPQGALVAYGILLNPVDGFQKKAKIDLEGVRTVLALRSKYAKPHKTLKDPSVYYDPSFYDAAMFK